MTTTRDVRIAFVGLAFVLLVPLALLIHRAIESARLEREQSHRAVAARIFDEMERELSMFLRVEEDRPFEHYRDFVLPSQSMMANLSLESSPLATAPGDPFVVGYFQIEPDGRVTTPHRVGGNVTQARIDSLVEVVGDHWRRGLSTRRNDVEERIAAADDSGEPEPAEAQTEMQDSKAEGALRELNRAAAGRQQRRTKMSQAPAASVYNFSSEDEDNVLQRQRAEPVPSPQRSIELEEAVEQSLQKKLDEPVAVRLEPMVGSAVDDQMMVLYRTVVIDRSGYRQGMLLNVGALLTWLESEVLASNRLGEFARLSIGEGVSTEPGSSSYRFTHSFAEPFGAMSAALVLAPLPELAGPRYVVALSALLLLAATAGVFAVYRTVVVAVAFAERRQNFVSAVSHELKTPLTAIRMYGEMLRDKLVASDEKRQRYYEVITAETERLSRLVDNVLELGKLERKERSLRTSSGEVRPVLEEAVAVIGPHAETEGFRVELSVEPDLPRAQFDRDALSQIVFNLLDNAVKYSRTSESRIVRLSARKDSGGVQIEVRDGGPGVRREHLDKIFEPFFRGESEMTRTAKGTGIGLSLVKGLVEKMGGLRRGAKSGRRGLCGSDPTEGLRAGAGGVDTVSRRRRDSYRQERHLPKASLLHALASSPRPRAKKKGPGWGPRLLSRMSPRACPSRRPCCPSRAR